MHRDTLRPLVTWILQTRSIAVQERISAIMPGAAEVSIVRRAVHPLAIYAISVRLLCALTVFATAFAATVADTHVI